MIRALLAALLCAGLLVTAGCSEGTSTGSTGTSSASSTPSAAASPRPSETPSETPSAAPTSAQSSAVEVAATVTDGKVSPRTHREKIAKGSQVRLVVTSDVADEVHVHGYDLEKKLRAGKAGTIEFTADETGLFEVEMHESGLQLLQLEVK